MTDISNNRLEEIALYGAQYNTTEARYMAYEILKLRAHLEKLQPIGIVTKVTESSISNDMWLEVTCEKGAQVKLYDVLEVVPKG